MDRTSTADEAVIVRRPAQRPTEGTAGIACHLPGMAASVSNLANATGDAPSDKVITTDIK